MILVDVRMVGIAEIGLSIREGELQRLGGKMREVIAFAGQCMDRVVGQHVQALK